MSRIGKQPVKIPAGVKVEKCDRIVKISGPIGALTLDVHPDITAQYDSGANEISVTRPRDERQLRALHGTTRALIANMVDGVTKGFEKSLQIFGAGYNVKAQGKELVLQVGYANAVSVAIPEGVTVEIKTPAARGNDTPAELTVRGPDKAVVGQLAANIRHVRKPEPYLGKGIRYSDEQVKRKVGKAFASSGA